MENIVSINPKRVFTIDEAQQLLPLVHRITNDAYEDMKGLLNQIEALKGVSSPRVTEIENRIEKTVGIWENKIQRLGATPKGLWLADFDNGHGYYCWRYPETVICYQHGYEEGFSGRKPI